MFLVFTSCAKESLESKSDTIPSQVSYIVSINKSKIKNDITLLFNIHDNNTYLQAKNSLEYTDTDLQNKFMYDSYYEVEIEKTIPLITIGNLGVDYSKAKEENRKAMTYTTFVSVRRGGVYRRYYVIIKYDNNSIERFKTFLL